MARTRLTPGTTLVLLLVVAVLGAAVGTAVLPRWWSGSPPAPAPAPSASPAPAPATPALPPVPRIVEREESTIITAIDHVRPSVVNIDTVAQVQTFFGVFPQQGAGSGVIVSADGYILTNNHVVEQAQQIKVTLLSGKTFQAKIVGTDRFADLAVIKVDAPDPLPAAPLGSSSGLRVGQLAIAIGNPFGLGHTATVGVISALNRSIQVPGVVIENLVQTDAPINPGNSGGALVDSGGRVVGINTAIVAQAQGIGFAIPIDTAKAIMDQLIRQGRVVRPYVGIEWGGNVDSNIAQQYNLPVDHGVIVRSVEPNSPAASAGIQPQDIIVAIDGVPVNNWDDFLRTLFAKRPGDTVSVEVFRDSRRVTMPVTLGERPR